MLMKRKLGLTVVLTAALVFGIVSLASGADENVKPTDEIAEVCGESPELTLDFNDDGSLEEVGYWGCPIRDEMGYISCYRRCTSNGGHHAGCRRTCCMEITGCSSCYFP